MLGLCIPAGVIGKAPTGAAGYINGFAQQQQIVIPSTIFPSGTTNFLGLYDETDLDNRTVANGGFMEHSSAWDLRFEIGGGAAGNGQKISHAIEKYSASTGELIAWFKIPIIKAGEDISIYRYWGKTGLTGTEEDKANCFSSYKRVFHLPTLADQTGSGATLVSVGTVNTDTTAMVGDAMSVAGTGLLRLDDVTFMDGASNFTLIIRAKVA